jgi:hypothetical protein
MSSVHACVDFIFCAVGIRAVFELRATFARCCVRRTVYVYGERRPLRHSFPQLARYMQVARRSLLAKACCVVCLAARCGALRDTLQFGCAMAADVAWQAVPPSSAALWRGGRASRAQGVRHDRRKPRGSVQALHLLAQRPDGCRLRTAPT